MGSIKTRKPRELDPLKAALARYFQNGIMTPFLNPSIREELGVTDVVVRNISATETVINVKTKEHGTRFFSVKLREMM